MGLGPFLGSKLGYAPVCAIEEMMKTLFGVLRKLGVGLLFLTVALCAAIIIVPPFLDRVYYEGPDSAHYDGARFFNPDGEDTARPPTGGSRGNFLFRFLTGSDGRPPWPDHVAVKQGYGAAEATPCPVMRRGVPENWKRCVDHPDPSRMFVTWIGHATVLIQTQGLNILTDPIYGPTAGPFGVGPRRVAEPGIAFDNLPKIDVVLVSHNHYDHMDLGTLKRLWDRDKPVIITSLGNDTLIRSVGIPARYWLTDGGPSGGVQALDWGGETMFVGRSKIDPIHDPLGIPPFAKIIVTRNHHWGSRWGTDRNRALWSSFVVKLPGGNIMFSGDTGFGNGQWPVEAARYGPIRLALIPIGAFRFVPGQMGIGSHIGPIDAAEVFIRSRARTAIGIHWGTFRLSYEAYNTPPKLLEAVKACRNIRGFDTVPIGRSTEVVPLTAPMLALPPPIPLDPKCLDTPAVRALR
jgi:L-ascorbate metabolism protein UlaG (beta-lactamase superfamily)